MEYEHREPIHGSDTDELLIGASSWDPRAKSIKYGWPDSRGHISRGGEMPVETVPQMVEALVREAYLGPGDVLRAVAKALDARAGTAASQTA